MRAVRAFFMCLGMFSAIPCPYRPWDEEARGLMTACLPLVGAVVGALWYALSVLGRMWLSEALSAAWIAALPLLLTGFMHLDGLMDTADALLSWRPLEERQKILKDVHCGSFSVVTAILLVLGMFAAASDCRGADLRALVLIPVASRCMSAFCVTALKPIGHSEYATLRRNMGTPVAALLMLALTLLAGGLWLGGAGLVVLIATVAGYGLAMAWAVHVLKGVSGDLAGCALCVGEFCGLVALAILCGG